MVFQLFHLKHFNALDGAFSLVTSREEYDSQITLTDAEAQMVIKYFGASNIHIGAVKNDKIKSSKNFLVYPSLAPIALNLNFPKSHKTELRLYLSSKAGFKPKPGEVWFLYINQKNKLVIGSINVDQWNSLEQEDPDDDNYFEDVSSLIATKQKIIKLPKPKIVIVTSGPKKGYYRNPEIAVASMQKSGYTCEHDSRHNTFIAQRTNLAFVEAHHFVPMKFQSDYTIPLDCIENVVSLCPNCHRGIHLGVIDFKRKLIENIFKKRGSINKFTLSDIYSFYNCIKPS